MLIRFERADIEAMGSVPSQRCPLLLLHPMVPGYHQTHSLDLCSLGTSFGIRFGFVGLDLGQLEGQKSSDPESLLHAVPAVVVMGIAPQVFRVTWRIIFIPALKRTCSFVSWTKQNVASVLAACCRSRRC